VAKTNSEHAYKTLLAEARNFHKNSLERLASKFIHMRLIEVTSDFLEKTIARPSGLAGAAIVSSIGVSVLYVVSIVGSFNLRGPEVILLWIIGYALGTTYGLISNLVKRP